MRNFRNAVGTCSALALLGGYTASQWAFVQRTCPEYAARVDCSPVRFMALCVLCAAAASSFFRDRDSEGSDR